MKYFNKVTILLKGVFVDVHDVTFYESEPATLEYPGSPSFVEYDSVWLAEEDISELVEPYHELIKEKLYEYLEW